MGHIRLGRLPRTVRWIAVVEELASPEASVDSVSDRTLLAASASLRRAVDERGCYLPLLNLSRLASAAHSEATFEHELAGLGIPENVRRDGLRLLIALENATSGERERHRTVFTDIAERAFREVVRSRVRSEAESLWGVSPENVRRAFARQSTEQGYSEAVRDWFSRFIGRTLQYFIDRELSNQIGRGIAQTSTDAVHLEQAVLKYAFERTRILRDYAPGWFSKILWTEGGIPEEAARRFFAYGIKKVLDDVALEQKEK
ncbi:MAG TPA: hypothetical protein VJV22_20740 [Acidobacteriaceae bacterium]|nr:hypothetical protein [Acidobacteriaceae bacterium]